jgi:hypothetical protein
VGVDERLRGCSVVGRLADGSPARAVQQVAAAVPAIVLGHPTEGCIAMGAHMWLDRAMRGTEALAARLKERGTDLSKGPYREATLHDRVRALLSVQQWDLVNLNGTAVIWFRELPLDVAELFVATARAGEPHWVAVGAQHPDKRDYHVDWSRPDEFLAMAWYYDEGQQSPEDKLYRIVARHLGISTSVTSICGRGRGL